MEYSEEINELLHYFKTHKPSSNFKRWNPDLYNKLVDETKFLPYDNRKTPLRRRLWHVENNSFDIPICSTCNKNSCVWVTETNEYSENCSISCANKNPTTIKNRQATILKKYGVKNFVESEEFKIKREDTFNRNYNGKHPRQTEEVKEKYRKTSIERYGTNHPLQNPEVLKHQRATNLKKFNREFSSQRHINDKTLSLLNDKEWLIKKHIDEKVPIRQVSSLLQVDSTTVKSYFDQHEIEVQYYYGSYGEREVAEFIKSLNVEVYTNRRDIIPPNELDIIIPTKKLAIEYCGLYWHSNIEKEKDYHKNKRLLCETKGIRLITLYEDEWIYKQNIVKEKIKSVLNLTHNRIFARKTYVERIDTNQKNEFFERTHIQGRGPGSITYGLIYQDELIACMTFIRQNDNVFILNRYSTSQQVVGGFSKLLKHFQKKHKWNKIVSFADLRWSEGNLYEKTGWTLEKITNPDYEYILGDQRYHKFGFRHYHLRKKLKNYDPSLTEKQNMENHNIPRIWNCGLKRYVLINR